MKILKFLLATLIAVCFAGCYEVNEEIIINDNGSGTYVTKMDLSQLIDMMQTMGAGQEISKDGMDRKIDTVIMMKSILDSAKDATPEQKELMKDAKMALKMDVKEKIFNINLDFPFKKLENLQALMGGMGGNASGLTSVFKNIFGKEEGKKEELDAPKDPPLGDMNSIFDVTVKKGLISKKLNQARYKTVMEKPEMAQIKDVSSSGMEVLYTTVIKLPRPVKKVDNPMIKLSADKKTVTMKYNYLELFETPEKFAYTIEY
jgi:hypothetical protein